MGFTDPQTVNNPTAGQPATAPWGDAVRDAAVYLATGKPRARVYNDAAISIVTSGTPQALTFNAERYDTGGTHSLVTNTGRLTVPTGEGGVYCISGHVAFASHATGRRHLSIFVGNGTTEIASVQVAAVNGASTRLSVTTDYALAAGDFVTLWVTQDSGAALNVTASGNYSPEFSFMWMST